jgi:tape measure domain-containing protein
MIQLDIIGALFATELDAQGEPLPPVALAGYHVNATHPVAAWVAQQVTPTSPSRTYGSLPTVFYSFADQAEFDAALLTADLTEPPEVPQEITARQAVQALISNGITEDMVDAAIAQIPDATQRSMVSAEWRRSQTFERSRPALNALAVALGISQSRLDQLFIVGKGL